MTPGEYKELKQLKRENLRDHKARPYKNQLSHSHRCYKNELNTVRAFSKADTVCLLF
jgi:hypothetical protein